MVRGRRVRAVVPCGKNDDCCSPVPKRKDHGVNNGKFISSTNNTQTITQFFQAVVGDIDDANQGIEEFCIKSRNAMCEEKIDALIEDGNDLDDREKEEFKEIITTPNMKVSKLKSVIDDLLSPPTPHRIELCLGEEEEKNQDDGKVPNPVIPTPKKAAAVTKTRRKLNNNQASNQTIGKIDKTTNNHKLSDFFPVRRSVRKTNKVVLEEKQRTLEDNLRKGLELGLKVQNFEGKGRGVIASQVFNRGDFVVEYSGDLIDLTEAKRREVKYAQDQNTGCYMYYFRHKGQQHCVDATAESSRLGRLVNHSRNGNLLTRTIDVDNKPRLVLIAKDTIEIGEEVTYDYGDRSKESLRYHPWLAY